MGVFLRHLARVASWAALGFLVGVGDGRAAGATDLDVGPPAPARGAGGRPTVRTSWVTRPPEIDGRLEEVWRDKGGKLGPLRQLVPKPGAPATYRSDVYVLHDADHLYIGFRFWDPEPESLVVQKMRRDDDVFSDDRVTIVFDTFLDRRNGYFFQITPAGTRADGLLENGRSSFEWDGIWTGAATIDDQGWSAEIALPFKTVSYRPQGERWGFNLIRIVRDIDERVVWSSPTPDISFFNLSGAGEIEGLTGTTQGLGLDLVPSFGLRFRDDGQSDAQSFEVKPSLDAFYRLTEGLTASLTVNTDFAGTEVDERVVNLTRFGVFFPERRQFFTRDGTIFDFGGLTENARPFFSRRIGLSADREEVDLLGAVKVTGRAGRFNIAILDAVQDEKDDVPVTNLAVARIAANVLEESQMGMILTSGDPGSDDDNLVWGLDGRYQNSRIFGWRRVLRATAFVQQSLLGGLDEDNMAWGGRVEYPNDRVNWLLGFQEIQENFDPRLGFVNRAGIRRYDANFRYRWRPDRFVRLIDVGPTMAFTTDTDDRLVSVSALVRALEIRSPRGDLLSFQYERRFEELDEPFRVAGVEIAPGEYGWNRFSVVAEASDSRPVDVSLTASYGGFFDGRLLTLSPAAGWRPSRYFALGARYSYNASSGLSGGDFTTHLAFVRASVQFTPDLFWTTVAQWDNQSDSIGIQSRVRWIIVPGRELALVLGQGLHVEDGRIERGETRPQARLFWTFRF